MVPIVTIDLSIYSIWPVIDKIFVHKKSEYRRNPSPTVGALVSRL